MSRVCFEFLCLCLVASVFYLFVGGRWRVCVLLNLRFVCLCVAYVFVFSSSVAVGCCVLLLFLFVACLAHLFCFSVCPFVCCLCLFVCCLLFVVVCCVLYFLFFIFIFGGGDLCLTYLLTLLLRFCYSFPCLMLLVATFVVSVLLFLILFVRLFFVFCRMSWFAVLCVCCLVVFVLFA